MKTRQRFLEQEVMVASLIVIFSLAGSVAAFAVGYLAIRFVLDVIRKGRFQYFAYYCFAVGLLFLVIPRLGL